MNLRLALWDWTQRIKLLRAVYSLLAELDSEGSSVGGYLGSLTDRSFLGKVSPCDEGNEFGLVVEFFSTCIIEC